MLVGSLRIFSGFGFCFNQKTAYDMRISDWSSDVCSSDLALPALGETEHFELDQHRDQEVVIGLIGADIARRELRLGKRLLTGNQMAALGDIGDRKSVV